MKRYLVMFAALTFLAMPGVVGAQETWIPPEAHWTPSPPARETVDAAALARVLMEKGVLTAHEYAKLTQAQAATSAGQRWDTARQPSASYQTSP